MICRFRVPGGSGSEEAHVADPDAHQQRMFSQYVLPEIEVLLRVAMSLTAQRADAEDLVQDTLLRAYRAVGRFDGRHPRAWLLTIMRHAEVSRRRQRRPRLLDDPDTELERLSPARDATPEELVVDTAFDEAVDAAFTALPLRDQQVVRLVHVDGLSYAEAAQVLDVPKGTVMSRLHRARRRIRNQLLAAGRTGREPERGEA
ncbi:putative ECF sigma factor RpoE1 [Streptomyces himastatinicus ATCC 53653]|uniref:RNA polymerase sigma factor n=1 Tax=Streptomyces himastatinicus ATCC 53653 TaxID=457427 RepID=D9WBT3_9ACTN|nr:putative ECF sigma factor RpoE1 [Streptomyces himastatinicus ATCC 53653]